MSKPDTTTPSRALRRNGVRLTKEQRIDAQEKFLRTFSMTANVRAACMSAGIARSTMYAWQETDQEFSLKFNIASEEANDVIRAELFRRAVQGYEKPVVSMGNMVYNDGKPLMERVYSDSLLSLLAKSRMPEFRDKQSMDLNATVNGKIDSENTLHIDVRALNADQLASLKALAVGMKGGVKS